jgi:hypothetical protein
MWRPLAVWLAVSTAAAGAGACVPGAWQTARGGVGPDVVPALLVAACATGLAVALTWTWLVATTTVGGLWRGRITPGGTIRRLVLLACGVAVVAGAGAPAVAADGDGADLLVGLSLPERAVAPAAHGGRDAAVARAAVEPARVTADTYVVRPGDSLWSIARSHPAGGSTDERWRAIWAANRDVVGADPDLIRPGQALRLPGAHPEQHADQQADQQADQDGDR